MIRYECPSCGSPLAADAAQGGLRLECPVCRREHVIPETDTRAPSWLHAEISRVDDEARRAVDSAAEEIAQGSEAEVEGVTQSLLEAGGRKSAEARANFVKLVADVSKKVAQQKTTAHRILGAGAGRSASAGGARPFDIRAALRARFRQKVLGQEVGIDLYLSNPFRILGLAASADAAQRDAARQRYNSLKRIDPARASRIRIATGYDEIMADDAHEEIVLAGLRDPQRCLLGELFWPHLDGDVTSLLRSESEGIVAREVLEICHQLAVAADGLEGVLAWHAVAVAQHNLALRQEWSGEAGAAAAYWEGALRCWSYVLEREEFWQYIGARVASYDDPRLRQGDVDTLREELPAAILCFNAMLASCYAQAGDYARCHDHLTLVSGAPMDGAARRVALVGGLDAISMSALKPLADRVRAGLPSGPARVSRKVFASICDPLLDDAFAAKATLSRFLAEDALREVEFDSIAAPVQKALASNVEYQGDDRERALLYSLIVTWRLLQLPLSHALSASLRQGLREDRKHLYGDFAEGDDDFDPTRCWFLEGAPADPDASETFPHHKITDTRGENVRWRSLKILVPRSRLAERFHSKRVPEADDVSVELAEQGRLYWNPVRAAAPPTELSLGGAGRVASLLDLLETLVQKPENLRGALKGNTLGSWLEELGQPALAEAARQGAGGSPDAFLPILRGATVCDVWAQVLDAAENAGHAISGAATGLDEELGGVEAELQEEIRARVHGAWDELTSAFAQLEATRRWERISLDGLERVRQSILSMPENKGRLQEAGTAATTASQASGKAREALQEAERQAAKGRLAPGAEVAMVGWGSAFWIVVLGWVVGQWLGLVGGFALALFVVSRAYAIGRKGKLKALRGEAERAEAVHRAARERVDAIEHSLVGPLNDRVKEIQALASEAREEAQKRIERVRREAVAELEAYAARLDTLMTSRRQGIDGVAEHGPRLLARLAKTFQPRAHNVHASFPPLRRAKAAGYSSGDRPSESTIQSIVQRELQEFMDSLTDSERRKIAVMMRLGGQEAGAKVVAMLIAMDRTERRRFLGNLPDLPF